MLGTKHGIHNKGPMRKRTLLSQQLMRGGLVLLMVGMVLMGSFAVAAPSTLRVTIGTFAQYASPTFVHIGTGTPIFWDNPTADLHSIIHDGCKTGERCAFDSSPLGPNGTFTVRAICCQALIPTIVRLIPSCEASSWWLSLVAPVKPNSFMSLMKQASGRYCLLLN